MDKQTKRSKDAAPAATMEKPWKMKKRAPGLTMHRVSRLLERQRAQIAVLKEKVSELH